MRGSKIAKKAGIMHQSKTSHREIGAIPLMFGLAVMLLGLAIAFTLVTPTFSHASPKTDDRVNEIMRHMTWKQKVAQMFVVSVPMKKAASVQKSRQFGGYVFFANDFKNMTPSRARKAIARIQKSSKVKALIAVDEEGGTVNRVSTYRAFRKTPFKSPRNVYKKGGLKAIRSDTKSKDKLLKSIGVNTNFAPVADTPYSSKDFMYRRSFSTSAKATSKYIRTVVGQMGKDEIVSTLKHFPGYGGNGDTHVKVIRDKRSKKALEKRDLIPFASGIRAGCDMIMVSHNIVKCFDGKSPASISKKVHSYLRGKMGFKGVIITDSLSMQGVAGYSGNSAQVAVKAVQAGNDILLFSGDYKKRFNAVYKALKSGKISKSQVNASVKRILAMKLNRGIIK